MMDRDLQRDSIERHSAADSLAGAQERLAVEHASRNPECQDRDKPKPKDERGTPDARGQIYQVTETQRETMFELGRFRTVAVEDLANHRYKGESREMASDLRTLIAQGLV